jgi:hypothetical protein
MHLLLWRGELSARLPFRVVIASPNWRVKLSVSRRQAEKPVAPVETRCIECVLMSALGYFQA